MVFIRRRWYSARNLSGPWRLVRSVISTERSRRVVLRRGRMDWSCNTIRSCGGRPYLKITSGTSSDLKNGSSSSTGKEDNNDGTVSSSRVQAVINMVKRQVGKPYVYGAAGPNSFDCSGLTYYCYKNAAGINLNRSSAAQASNGRYVSKSELKPGDLIFFNSGTNRIRHVGMYVGNGQFIHAPSPGKSVKYENLYSSYYVKGYVTARRIIG